MKIKNYVFILLLIFSGMSYSYAKNDSITHKYLVRLNITKKQQSLTQPWQTLPPKTIIGHGIMIDKNHLLTTSDLLNFAQLIQIETLEGVKKITGHVSYYEPETNLAIIKLDHQTFKHKKYLKIADTVSSGDKIKISWVTHNKKITTANGVILSPEIDYSYNTMTSLLSFKVFSEFSPSGHSQITFIKDKVAGIVYSVDYSTNNLKVISPNNIKSFIQRFKNQKLKIPKLGFNFRKLNVPVTREYLGIPEEKNGGILIESVYEVGTGSEQFMPNDILFKLDKYEINSSGYYKDKLQGQLLFTNIINKFNVNDTIQAKVFRKNKFIDIPVKIQSFDPEILSIPDYFFFKKLDYHVFAGLKFMELSTDLIYHISQLEYISFLDPLIKKYFSDYKFKTIPGDKKRIIILTGIIPDKINESFHNLSMCILDEVNGYKPVDLNDLKMKLNSFKDDFFSFSFEDYKGEIIIPNDNRLIEANNRITDRYLN